MEKSPCKLNLLHCLQKTTTSLWNRNEKGIGKTRKMRPQANNAQYNTQVWDIEGGGSGVRRQWEGRGWTAPLCQLINEPGEMVWLLLTVIRNRGTAETRRCDADAVRSQVITWNPALTLCASYLPLPPPPAPPLFLRPRPLSSPLLI